MGRINLNPRLAKGGRSYDIIEIARLYGIHPHTVRSWRKAGLKAIDDGRPSLYQGGAVSAFLAGRRAKAKRPCPPGSLYCLKCREPRPIVAGSAEYREAEHGAGMLKAHCSVCRTGMNRRANRAQVAALLPGEGVRTTRDAERIAGCAEPRPNHDKLKDEKA